MQRAHQLGVGLNELEQWAIDRSGEPLTHASRLLFRGSGGVPGEVRRRLVVELPDEMVADGTMQWPATASLIEDRLGPRSLVVSDANLQALIEQLRSVGVELKIQIPGS
ncbi:MAG: hypothetical protein K8T89_13240 [Planctomycetes bacterium]|nr:hypothetical protein [Planctomycetota bacterium]